MLDQTLAALDAFVPSEDEHEDIARLYEITDRLIDTAQILAATPSMASRLLAIAGSAEMTDH